jgi:hypothetical protein
MSVPSNLHFTSAATISLLGATLASSAIAYLVLAIWRVFRFREGRRPNAAFRPAVTIMAPVHGAPPGLYDCLRSLCLLRWMRSTRACRPLDHALSVVMHALALVSVSVGLHSSMLGLALLSSMLALRVSLHYLLRARSPIPAPPAPWLLPARECLNFALWAASFASRRMSWGCWGTDTLQAAGGRCMTMQKGGTH